MKWKNVFTIAKKDWIEVRQNKYAMVAMLIVPVIFVIIMPLGVYAADPQPQCCPSGCGEL